MRSLLLPWALIIGAVVAATPRSAEADEPYELTVCLRFADDPIFTRFFVESVRRQVRDQLVNYFGALANVQVTTSHPLLEKLDSASLADLSIPPEEFVAGDLRGKVFLMTVDFQDGLYRVRWRQVHGSVQYLGPPFGQATPDRLWLAKAICLAVKGDFAPVASVQPTPGSSEVGLSFRGADQADRLAGWLEGGCVLQPFWILRQQDGSLASKAIPNTALNIAPGADWTKATVLSGLANPWRRTARVADFRAVKLTTRRGQFRLRLVNSEDGSPVASCVVYANSVGFAQTTDKDRLPEPDRKGYVVADRQFDQVAYITIRAGREFKLLLPITEAELEKELAIPVDEQADQKSDWQRQLRYCVQDLQAVQTLREQCIRDVNDLNEKKRYEEALERVETAVELLRPLVATAAENVSEIEAEAEKVGTSESSLLGWTRKRATELQDRVRQLGELGASLADTIEKVDAQSRAEALLKLAAEAREAGDIDETIAKYGQALKEWPDLPQVKELLAELREMWRIKSPEHERARRFVYEQYAQSPMDDLADVLPEAQRVFDQLAGLDDQLTVMKLARINGEHVATLSEIEEMLADRDSEADRAERETYRQLLEDVLEFQDQVFDFIKARDEGRPPPARPRNEKQPAPVTEDEPQAEPPPTRAEPKPSDPEDEEEEEEEEEAEEAEAVEEEREEEPADGLNR